MVIDHLNVTGAGTSTVHNGDSGHGRPDRTALHGDMGSLVNLSGSVPGEPGVPGTALRAVRAPAESAVTDALEHR